MMLLHLILLGLLSGVIGEQVCRCPCGCSTADSMICGDKSEPDQCLIPKAFPEMEESGTCTDIGGLCQGRRVTVAGTVTEDPKRFTINFMTADGGVALHFDVRFKFGAFRNTIVMNYKEPNKGYVADETRLEFTDDDFSANNDYELTFTVDGDTFKISNRGKELASFTIADVFSMADVSRVCVHHSTKKITVSLDNPNASKRDLSSLYKRDQQECTCSCGCGDPNAAVCGTLTKPDQCLIEKTLPTMATSGSCVDIRPLCQGRQVTVSGKVCSNFNRFTTNFMTDDGDVALHFDVRKNYGNWKETINMNSRMNDKDYDYSKKQVLRFPKGGFPFAANEDYAVTFAVEGDTFKITKGGDELGSFKLRNGITWEKVARVCMEQCTTDITVSLDNV